MHSLDAHSMVLVNAAQTHRVATGAIATIAFTGLAWFLRGVTVSGAVAGAIVSFAIFVCAGPGAFAALVLVFVIALGTTRTGYSRKQKLGAAESREGRRGSQIFANVGISALSAALFGISQNPNFLIAFAAALAEAAADTASSELGEAASDQARLITTWELVPAGTNGGVTLRGSLAAAIASVLIAGSCVFLKLIPRSAFVLVSCAGFIGTLIDSALGATLERRRLLNNDTVNLLGTLSAALIAFVLTRAST